MNREEAERAASGQRQSFLCIVLRVQTRQVGVLYLDSAAQDIFKDAAATPADTTAFDVKATVESLPAIAQLAEGVDKAMEGLRGGGTYLHF
jgi:hypothetical protein